MFWKSAPIRVRIVEPRWFFLGGVGNLFITYMQTWLSEKMKATAVPGCVLFLVLEIYANRSWFRRTSLFWGENLVITCLLTWLSEKIETLVLPGFDDIHFRAYHNSVNFVWKTVMVAYGNFMFI